MRLKAGKENKTLTDPQGPDGDCEAEKLEVMQSKPVGTLLQICNRTEEVQPSGTQHHIASRIPKLKHRPVCDLNSETKSSRAKETSESGMPERDCQRFDTQQLHSVGDDNMQEHKTDHDMLQDSLSLTLPLSEPSHSPIKTLSRKRVKKMTTPVDWPELSSNNKIAEQENVTGSSRAKKRKDGSIPEFMLTELSLDAGPSDLDLDSVIPPEASTGG